MPRREPKAVIAHAQRAWERKRQWYSLIYECWHYAAPGMNPYYGGDEPSQNRDRTSPGQRRHNHLFDSTLPRAAERLPNRMVSDMCPQGEPWGRFRPGPMLGTGEESPAQAEDMLADLERTMYAALHASNIQMVLGLIAMDACISGTGLLKGGISTQAATLLEWEAVNQADVAFEAGPAHSVWGFYRKMDLPVAWMRILWPDAANLPAEATEEVQGTARPKEYKVHETTYFDSLTQLWYYDVVVDKSDGGPQRIFEKDYLVCPWICWRYALLPGEVQGRSPTMAALPTARTLNYAKRVRLESASMRVAGMYTYVNDSTFNPRTVRLGSGAFLQVGSNSRENPTIRPLELAGDPRFGELVIDDEKNDLRELMHDYPQPQPTPQMTAFEFAERDAEAKQNRGQPYQRMAEELLRPLIRLSTYLLAEAGQLPQLQAVKPPLPDGRPSPLLLDGTDVKVDFVSPLQEAHRQRMANKIFQWVGQVAQTVGPEGMHAGVVTENVARATGEELDIPDSLIREEGEAGAMLDQQLAAGGQPAAGGAPQGMLA